VERVPGAGPCQALAAEGGGRKARLYKRLGVPGYNRHPADRWAEVQDTRSRHASCRALHHPFEFQKSQSLPPFTKSIETVFCVFNHNVQLFIQKSNSSLLCIPISRFYRFSPESTPTRETFSKAREARGCNRPMTRPRLCGVSQIDPLRTLGPFMRSRPVQRPHRLPRHCGSARSAVVSI
jgi:hypothetical protein